MLDYRCYFLDARGKFKDVRVFKSTDDDAAVLSAIRLLSAQDEFDKFELWEGARLVVSSPQIDGTRHRYDFSARDAISYG